MGVDIIEARRYAHLLAYTLPVSEEFNEYDESSMVIDADKMPIEPDPQQVASWAVASAIGEAATSQGMVLALTGATTQITDLDAIVR